MPFNLTKRKKKTAIIKKKTGVQQTRSLFWMQKSRSNPKKKMIEHLCVFLPMQEKEKNRKVAPNVASLVVYLKH